MPQKLFLVLLLLAPASQAADFLFATHKLNVPQTKSLNALQALCGYASIEFDITYLASNNEAINKTTNRHINQMLCGAFYALDKCDFGDRIMTDAELENVVEMTAADILKTQQGWLNSGAKNCSATGSAFTVKIEPQYFGHYHGLEQIMIDDTEYPGGADSYYLRYLLLTPDGKRLEYHDLFLPGSDEKLQLPLAEAWNNREEVKKGNGFPKDEESDFPQTNNLFSYTNNLLFTAQGLMVHYQHYEIASFAEGDPQLVIPYEKLKGILKDKYLPLPNKTPAP